MHPSRLARFCSALACSGLVAVLGATAVQGAPAERQLVGLGDSYASGLGAGDYGDSGDCKRSQHAYAVLDSQRIGAALTFAACSGATTADVDSDQLSALSASTTDATLTVGGNDAGFVEVLTTCALPGDSGCSAAIDVARGLIKHVLPGRLDSLYADIAADAPGAHVVVVGYPRLFDGQDCSEVTSFSRKEMTRLNGTADRIDAVIRRQAKRAGFAFVDPRAAFDGHALCDAKPWLHNVTQPFDESFHPTVAGQAAFAALVGRRLSMMAGAQSLGTSTP